MNISGRFLLNNFLSENEILFCEHKGDKKKKHAGFGDFISGDGGVVL